MAWRAPCLCSRGLNGHVIPPERAAEFFRKVGARSKCGFDSALEVESWAGWKECVDKVGCPCDVGKEVLLTSEWGGTQGDKGAQVTGTYKTLTLPLLNNGRRINSLERAILQHTGRAPPPSCPS